MEYPSPLLNSMHSSQLHLQPRTKLTPSSIPPPFSRQPPTLSTVLCPQSCKARPLPNLHQVGKFNTALQGPSSTRMGSFVHLGGSYSLTLGVFLPCIYGAELPSGSWPLAQASHLSAPLSSLLPLPLASPQTPNCPWIPCTQFSPGTQGEGKGDDGETSQE